MGPAVLFFCVVTPGFNIDSFTMVAVTDRYEGGAVIPGKIEAEEFDYGGQGVAYSDVDARNRGGVSSLRYCCDH